MKNSILPFITILSLFSFNCFAQKNVVSLTDKKGEYLQKVPHTQSETRLASVKTVKYYRVKENINMKFGGYTTTYDVSDLRLVRTNDLGPNNTRVVTSYYEKEIKLTDYKSNQIADTLKSTSKPYHFDVINNSNKNERYAYINILKACGMVTHKGSNFNDLMTTNIRVLTTNSAKVTQHPDYLTETLQDTLKAILNSPIEDLTDDSKKLDYYIYIDILKTYERVLEKGYKSIDMFQKIGNAYYFNTELEKAARWYAELFAMTSDLEPVYYYRYAQSLQAIGQNGKATSMMEKFILKNQQNDSSKIPLKNNHYEK